jgi:hypothetical protein
LDSDRFLYLTSVWLYLLAALLGAGGMLSLVAVIVPLLHATAAVQARPSCFFTAWAYAFAPSAG